MFTVLFCIKDRADNVHQNFTLHWKSYITDFSDLLILKVHLIACIYEWKLQNEVKIEVVNILISYM